MEASTDRDASLRPVLILVGTALMLYVADQLTKAAITATMAPGDRYEVIGNLVMIWFVTNTGAAFSLFPGATWLFLTVTAAALVMIVYFHRSLARRSAWIHVVLGTILAGTLGNLTDRLRLGYVVDFVSVGIGDLRWPTFNVADSAVVLGIAALVAYLTFFETHGEVDRAAQ